MGVEAESSRKLAGTRVVGILVEVELLVLFHSSCSTHLFYSSVTHPSLAEVTSLM